MKIDLSMQSADFPKVNFISYMLLQLYLLKHLWNEHQRLTWQNGNNYAFCSENLSV